MLFFPKQMMEGYQAKTFGGASETFFMWMLGLMGVQMLGSAFLCATLRYDAASPKARALACLGQVICWGIFFVVDGKCLLTGTVPKAMPPEAFMVNLVIFAVVSAAGAGRHGAAGGDFAAGEVAGGAQECLRPTGRHCRVVGV